jgi:hypothetical protein
MLREIAGDVWTYILGYPLPTAITDRIKELAGT